MFNEKLNTGLYIFYSPILSVCMNCSELARVAHGVVFCCSSPSTSTFNMLCVQRCSSAYVGFIKWWFELLLPSYHQPLTLTRRFYPGNCCSLNIFTFTDHSLCVGKSIPEGQHIVNYSDQQPYHIQSHLITFLPQSDAFFYLTHIQTSHKDDVFYERRPDKSHILHMVHLVWYIIK